MTRPHLLDAEPVSSAADHTGSLASGALAPLLEIARGWAGPRRLALLLSGSHASGEAVWVEHGGRRVSLSDLDLYALLPDRAARDEAEARARAGRAAIRPRLLELGLAAPLEVGFLTPSDLERLPARPATLALARHARVLDGDPAWRARVPAWKPRDVSREEILLLLENRAFELLAARAAPAAGVPLDAFVRRHATLKCALDLALALALAEGELPEGAEARVAWARARWPRLGGAEPPWDAALAWRRGVVVGLDPAAERDEWTRAAAAWVAVWRHVLAPGDPRPTPRLALAAARRARLRRRVRLALHFPSRSGRGPSAGQRLARFWRGTPQHRLDASAAVVVASLASAPEGVEWPAACDPESRRALGRLAVLRGERALAEAPAALVRLWDAWILDGQRLGSRA